MYKIDKEGGGAKNPSLEIYILSITNFWTKCLHKILFHKAWNLPRFLAIKVNAQIAQPIHSLTIAVLKIHK